MRHDISISLSRQLEAFIQNEINEGHYSSVSEVVKAGLQLMEREKKLNMLRNTLTSGEKSEFAKNFNPEEFKARLRSCVRPRDFQI
jgi:antitoxin ParD1/3/4